MDRRETTRPVLHPLVEQLLARRAPGRVRGCACPRPRACPSPRCRCSSPRSTSTSAARSSACCPRTPTRATPPRRPRWFLGEERVALLPEPRRRAGSSGLEPPPHLVGERARALDVLAARRARLRLGGRARRAAAAAARRGPSRSELAVGDEPGIDGARRALALAGYERVERVEERGQFAVRGGLVDVFPTTGREPLRIELFGDEIEAIRAFSPFTQRALHAGRGRDRLPGRRAAARPRRARRCRRRGRAAAVPDDLVPPLDRAAGPRLASPTRCARSGRRSSSVALPLDGRRRARPVPARAAVRVRGAAARRSPRAGSPRPSSELAGFVRAGQPRRRRLPAPRRGAPHRQPAAPGRAAAARGRRRAPATSRALLRRLARAPRLRLARPRARAPARTRRSSASARRARDARLGRALAVASPTCAPATTSSTRTTASASCSASRRRGRAASRATTSSSRFRGEDRLYVPHEQIGKVSRYIGADAKRARALEARRQGLAERSRAARARAVRELAGELLAPLRAAPAGRRASPFDLDERVARAARGRVPVPRDRGPAARDRGGQGGPRGAAPDGPARLRRRRLRQDRGRGARRLRRRASTASRR